MMRWQLPVRVLCLFSWIVGIVGMAGCQPATTGSPDGTGDGAGVKRLILLTNGDDPFWDAARVGMNKAADDLQLKDANLAVFLDKGDFSDELQISKLSQYATQSDIAAVAISPVDPEIRGIADALRDLRNKGVHVICIDSDMDVTRHRDTRFAYLGTNNVMGGTELGRTAQGLRPDGGVYATFVGLKAVANAQERIGGFAIGAGESFREADSLQDQGDENIAQENVKVALNNHADIDTLVGIWAYNAHAIVEVVKQRDLRDQMTIVVFDAAEAALEDMSEGYIDAMVVQNPYQMGYLGTQLMKALVEQDHAVIKEMYPDYDEATGEISAGGDVYTTDLRVVVPDDTSPLTPEMFEANTKFFTYAEFSEWLAERKLTGS